MSADGVIDAWAQMPLRGAQLVPEVRRLLERSGTAEVLRAGVTSTPPSQRWTQPPSSA